VPTCPNKIKAKICTILTTKTNNPYPRTVLKYLKYLTEIIVQIGIAIVNT